MSAAPNELTPGEDKADRITWRQILVGYVIVLITACVVVGITMMEPGDLKMLMYPVVFAGAGLSILFEKRAQELHASYLAPHAAFENGLQWAAIALLGALGFATTVFAILTIPAQPA